MRLGRIRRQGEHLLKVRFRFLILFLLHLGETAVYRVQRPK